MFSSLFQDSGKKLRKIVSVFFVIYLALMVIAGVIAIGYAWLAGMVPFLISLVAVPVSVIVSVLFYYLSILPNYVLAETACQTEACLESIREMLKTDEERRAVEERVEIDPRTLPTWKRVEMLKRGQMVMPQTDADGKYVCPVCGGTQESDEPVCEKCGMLFYTK